MQADGVIEKYAIGGAVAAVFYLVEPDTTEDVDVFAVLTPPPGRHLVSLDQIRDWLTAQGYRFDAKGDALITDWPVQFLPSTPLVEEALERAIAKDFDGETVRVFTLEHLAAIALQLGRPKDKSRLERFLTSQAFDSSRFSDILERHALLDRWSQFQRQRSD